MPRAGTQPQDRGSAALGQGERAVKVRDRQLVPQGVLSERGAILDRGLVVAQVLVELGALGAFQFGQDRPQVLGLEVPHGGRSGQHRAFGGPHGDPIAADEVVAVEAAQDV